MNDMLRRGLRAMAEGDKPRPRFATNSVDLGPPLLPLDNVAEALSDWAGSPGSSAQGGQVPAATPRRRGSIGPQR